MPLRHLLPLLFLPLLDSCLLVNPNSKCQCPPIGYIDQSGIANSEYGSYLANRTTTRPKVRVSDECLIMADVSALHTPNHFLMLFRTAAPPIFAKRLSESSDKIINLTDIYCVANNDGQFNWMYYGGVVNDLSVAVQTNEGMCECSSIPLYAVKLSNMSTCDTFGLLCNLNVTDTMTFLTVLGTQTQLPWTSPTTTFVESHNKSILVEDFTCVSGSWYINNVEVDPYVGCSTSPLSEISPCGCLSLNPLKPYSPVYTYAEDGAFADYALSTGVEKYTGCKAELICPANATLVIFSLTWNPLVYVPGTKPSITCASSSLATSSLSMKQLYIDGLIISEPSSGCYEKKCPCLFAYLEYSYAQNYVGAHPSLQKIASALFNHAPYSDGSFVDGCPTNMQCVNTGENLINLDTNDTARVIATKPYQSDYLRANVSCSASTGKWMINGEEHNRLYAICLWGTI